MKKHPVSLFFITASLVLNLFFLKAEQAKVTPPNIIFIIVDDLGYGDFSCNGSPIVKTPNMDYLHDHGAHFEDFLISPTCSPTRSAIMTGRHEFLNGVTHTIFERERMTLQATTIAEVLKNSGYATGIFGKWHLGDEEPYQPQNRGFEEVFIHGGGGIGQTYSGSCGDVPNNRYQNPTILHNGTFEKTNEYCTDLFFNRSLDWIKSLKGKKPFFCYLATNAAHVPLEAKAEDEAKYAGKVSPDLAKFFGMISNIDDNVGNLLKELKKLEIEKNTLIVLINDNGGFAPSVKLYNAGMRGTKSTPFRGGTRAASFWYWPGTIEPRSIPQFTAHIDIFPTLSEIAGIPIPAKLTSQVEGLSLLPLLKGKPVAWPERTLITHVGRWGDQKAPETGKYKGVSVRTPQYNLVSLENNPASPLSPTPSWQLFDIKADGSEQTDLAKKYPEIVKNLSSTYENWWNKIQPSLINEFHQGPEMNPFKILYWKQFGGMMTKEEYVKAYPKKVIKE